MFEPPDVVPTAYSYREMPVPESVPLHDACRLVVEVVYCSSVTLFTTGAELSTTIAALGPAAAARLPALSFAEPAATDIRRVPSPLIPDIVTVRMVVPEPVTATVPFAVPVLSKVISAAVRVT